METLSFLEVFLPTPIHQTNKKESLLHSLLSQFQKSSLFGTLVIFETLEYVPLRYLLKSIFKQSKCLNYMTDSQNLRI